jgi:hypothetical protein
MAVLVSGVAALAAQVARALRARGTDVTEITDVSDSAAVAAACAGKTFDSYVQLAETFEIRGDSAIERVRHFYADGVLNRFTVLAAVLPALTPTAHVTFVLGHLPPEVATDDDREARRALTRVLSHAARADTPDGHLTVRILHADAPPDQIAQVALGLDPNRQDTMDRLDELSYADWRVELLGLASVET